MHATLGSRDVVGSFSLNFKSSNHSIYPFF
jgi:hypothetical protein